jgi:Putative S-adenosyl-L-methionine-dependent methyltransferase
MLVRKYIHQRLQEYYAQPFDKVVGSLHQPYGRFVSLNNNQKKINRIPFRYLLGEYHWNYIYGNLYRNTVGQWLTPSELFSPYYGQCIALWIIQQIEQVQHEDNIGTTTATATISSGTVPKNIEIIELGGGRGTNAIDILDYIHQHYYEMIYQHITSYTILDSSKPLLQYQNENFYNNNTNAIRHTSKIHTRYLDLYNYACTDSFIDRATTTNQQPSLSLSENDHQCSKVDSSETTITIIIGLEILDNLPHDKIRVTMKRGTNNHNKTHATNANTISTKSLRNTIVEQAELIHDISNTVSNSIDTEEQTNSHHHHQQRTCYKEVYVPLTDPLLQNVLQYYPLVVSNHQTTTNYYNDYWIPTIACTIINKILQERPNALFLFADFDCFMNVIPKKSSNDNTTDKNNNKNKNDSHSFPVPAIGEPIVTDMNDCDLVSYLHPSDTVTDILFPTNFHTLASYIQSIQRTTRATTDKVVTIQKQYDFLQFYGPQQVIATTSYLTGYSPMIHDFENCTVLTIGVDSSKNFRR